LLRCAVLAYWFDNGLSHMLVRGPVHGMQAPFELQRTGKYILLIFPLTHNLQCLTVVCCLSSVTIEFRISKATRLNSADQHPAADLPLLQGEGRGEDGLVPRPFNTHPHLNPP
jgi:hypothetical protein